jgi:hypothetical protein
MLQPGEGLLDFIRAQALALGHGLLNFCTTASSHKGSAFAEASLTEQVDLSIILTRTRAPSPESLNALESNSFCARILAVP